MTALRPEHDAGREAPYGQGAYGAAGAFEAAVEQLADPLNDPLPGQERPASAADPVPGPGTGTAPGPGPGPDSGATSPWFRSGTVPQAARQPDPAYGQPQYLHQQYAPYSEPVQEPVQAVQEPQQPLQQPQGQCDSPGHPEGLYGGQRPVAAPEPVFDDETVALRTDDTRRMADADAEPGPVTRPVPVTGGRAERRRAAKAKGQGTRGKVTEPERSAAEAPRTRLEARRAARAAKDSPAVVASRFFGEMFITLGVLMLLFVTYQLWWTNVRSGWFAGNETEKIQDGWDKGRKPGAFEPGQGFAIMHIPKLDVVVPIAEGINKARVLDNGMVGHYAEGKLKTAMPSDKQGNFAVAGHRNTHGEPFRYINQLKPGDPIVVETQDTYYTYEMASILPQTPPSNVGVIAPVPPGSGFTRPGRYITLTTCTPEFTSTYRMIVWGKMVDERPRSKGQPDALVG
ncbi:class E sortase [Streptomyces sp. ISL-100]|uniref:class E sortase n=1 Tax=Streptomyces sp. ISL-100 TaxID=2819173 RepID=UPI001BEADE58|nr:class E sortase [Streptomyces sp. ISL-100]MBT2394725.1 class E sortase [Streptomyces sp. ISL-100]